MLMIILYLDFAITLSIPLRTLDIKKFFMLGRTTPIVYVLPDFKFTANLLGL